MFIPIGIPSVISNGDECGGCQVRYGGYDGGIPNLFRIEDFNAIADGYWNLTVANVRVVLAVIVVVHVAIYYLGIRYFLVAGWL